MSDKDEIKELFQKELGNYEAKVDTSLWNGIQSGLSGTSAVGGTVAGMSVVTKAIIGVVVATVVTISSIVLLSKEESKNNSQAKVEKNQPSQETKQNVSQDLVISESNEDKEEIVRDKNETIINSTIEEREDKSNKELVVEVPKLRKTDEVTTLKEDFEKPAVLPTSTNDNQRKEQEKNEVEKPLIADISIEKQENQYVKFKLVGENIKNVEWSFGDGRYSYDISPEHFYEEPGSFEVKANVLGNDDNIIEKKITITVDVEGKFTKLPNIFSPNSDGSNDEFFIEHEGIEEFQLNIFDRQQKLLFTTDNPNFRWRGYNQNGVIVPQGKYIYVIIAKDKAGNVINKYETLEVTR